MSDIFYERLKHFAETQPERILFAEDNESHTYAEVLNEVNKRAATLPHLPGTSVAIQVDSPYEQWLRWLTYLAVDMRPVLFHADMKKDDVKAICNKHQLVNEDTIVENRDISSIPPQASFGVLSSGSTGIPKLFWRTSKSWADFFPVQNPIFAINNDSQLFFHGSLSFTGNMNSAVSVFWEGGGLITSRYYKPRTWVAICKKYNVNSLYLLPVKLRQFLKIGTAKELCDMQSIFAGSQALDHYLAEQLQKTFPAARFTLYYGAGELNYITYCTLEEWQAEPGIVGRPFPGVKIRIENELIYVTTAYGVIGTEKETTIGDAGSWTDSGMILFEGRRESVINCAGRKISVQHVENRLREQPEIEDIAVFPVPDEVRGQVPAAAVIPMADYSADEIRRTAEILPSIERPRYWYIYEKFPVNQCSKVDYRKLREHHMQQKKAH